ncbi:hypothetical protein LTR08_005494 [Meristemomyces frigidus]|nr:hypothetical protein LTR08_005494 [Meristemomyces frigidus]
MDDIDHAFQALSVDLPDDARTPQAIATLAAASRAQPAIRSRLADPNVLGLLTKAVGCSLDDNDLENASLALRCIGNACIDNDAGRDAICSLGFSWAHRCLSYPSSQHSSGDSDSDDLVWLTVKVLHNICSDHAAAQLACSEARLYIPLIAVCASPRTLRKDDDRSLLIDLLFCISVQRSEHPPPTPESLPDNILEQLLRLPSHLATVTDLEEYATVLEINLTFLRDPAIQTQIVRARRVAHVWLSLQETGIRLRKGEPESQELLKPLSSSLSWCLSDIAAHAEFAQTYDLDDPLIKGLLHIIRSEGEETPLLTRQTIASNRATLQPPANPSPRAPNPDPHLLPPACQILGNLLRLLPPPTLLPLLTPPTPLQTPLWHSLLTTTDSESLYSLASLLHQLTRPSPQARELLGQDPHAAAALTLLCGHPLPQIRQAGVRLLRALGRECAGNRARFEGVAREVVVAAGRAGEGELGSELELKGEGVGGRFEEEVMEGCGVE